MAMNTNQWREIMGLTKSKVYPETIDDCLSHLDITDLEREFAIVKFQYILENEKYKVAIETTQRSYENAQRIVDKVFDQNRGDNT